MHTAHWIQLGMLALGIFLLALAFSNHDPADGDASIVNAIWALFAVAGGAALIAGSALWFVIGGILAIK